MAGGFTDLEQVSRFTGGYAMITQTNGQVWAHFKGNTERIKDLCQQWPIQELALFGSALRSDFRADSDVDILVEFFPDARISLLDLIELQFQFSELLERKVDLVEKQTIVNSPNWIRRNEILNTALVIYEKR